MVSPYRQHAVGDEGSIPSRRFGYLEVTAKRTGRDWTMCVTLVEFRANYSDFLDECTWSTKRGEEIAVRIDT